LLCAVTAFLAFTPACSDDDDGGGGEGEGEGSVEGEGGTIPDAELEAVGDAAMDVVEAAVGTSMALFQGVADPEQLENVAH
jgi:hypothetical protein